MFTLLPRALKFRKDMAAQKVQRYVRRYVSRRKVLDELRMIAMKRNMQYFESLKARIMATA